ncbi:MAG: hypothetical protein AB1756_04785 [Acidobacteriota bacterium]
MRTTIIRTLIIISLAILFSNASLSEVSVEVDSDGNYLKTIYVEKQTGKTLKIWTKFGNKPTIYTLNENGDLNGDLRPAIKENVAEGSFPYVLWPRFDGNDYEIVFSKWMTNRWADIAPVEDVDNSFDDLSPSLDFDNEGRPYIAWWRDENDVGRVYVSVFLKTRWMDAFPISDEDVDSWDPQVRCTGYGEMEVTYSTQSGQQTKIVILNFPDTITDDIDPFGTSLINVENGESNSTDLSI